VSFLRRMEEMMAKSYAEKSGGQLKEVKAEICGRCGRVLKTEKSIERGYGPVCIRKVEQEEWERDQAELFEDEDIKAYLEHRKKRIARDSELTDEQ